MTCPDSGLARHPDQAQVKSYSAGENRAGFHLEGAVDHWLGSRRTERHGAGDRSLRLRSSKPQSAGDYWPGSRGTKFNAVARVRLGEKKRRPVTDSLK